MVLKFDDINESDETDIKEENNVHISNDTEITDPPI